MISGHAFNPGGSFSAYGLSIRYVCENYLTMGLEGPYDLVTLIYCDYGVLPAASREHLMNKVYDALRPGGRFLLDVCSRRQYETFEERRSWEARDGGFWSVDSHLCLHAYLKYPDLTTLHQALVLTREEARSYFIWEHCFTLDRLIGEAVKAGFRLAEAFSDVAGKRYADDSPTIATLLEKP